MEESTARRPESGRLEPVPPMSAEPSAAAPAASRISVDRETERAMAVAKGRVRIRSRLLTGLFTLAILYTCYFAQAVLIPIALALLLNLLLAPVVRGLRRYLRLPEGFGAALVLLTFVALVVGTIYGLSGPATRWFAQLPVAMTEVRDKVETLRRPVKEVQQAAKKVENLAQDEPRSGDQQPVQVAVQGPGLTQMFLDGALTVIAGLVVMIALLFFLLASGDTLLRQAVTIAPRLGDKRRVVEIVRETEDDVSYYLLTVSLINAGLGLAVGIAMFILDMPNALLWGVMAGVFNFVPFLGAVTGIGIVGLVALLTFDQAWSIFLPPLSYLCLTSLEAQFVTPALLARRLTLNPLAVFLALIVWTWMWGIAGALLAVPLLATFKICCDHLEPLQPIGTMLGR
jgi:predicted PurR-regulated permease PerM